MRGFLQVIWFSPASHHYIAVPSPLIIRGFYDGSICNHSDKEISFILRKNFFWNIGDWFRLWYLFTQWSRVLLEKLTDSQLVKKFPAFFGTRRFITAFTSARQLSLFWASSIQSMSPYSTSWRSILILSSHLRLGLPSGFFHLGFPIKTLYTSLISPIRAAFPAQLILLDFIIRKILGEEYWSFSSALCSFLHFPVTSSHLGPNILQSTHPHTKSVKSLCTLVWCYAKNVGFLNRIIFVARWNKSVLKTDCGL